MEERKSASQTATYSIDLLEESEIRLEVLNEGRGDAEGWEAIWSLGVDPWILATAIEKYPLYRFDRFWRMREVDTEGKQQALDALADCQNWEAMQWKIWQALPAESRDQNGPDLDDYPGAAFLNTFLFHKGDGHWPDFNAIAKGAGWPGISAKAAGQRQSAKNKAKETALVLLMAVAKAAQFDVASHGVGAALERAAAELGVVVSADTVMRYLAEAKKSVNFRRM